MDSGYSIFLNFPLSVKIKNDGRHVGFLAPVQFSSVLFSSWDVNDA